MILITYGTRPEYIKIKPLIDQFNQSKLPYKLLFTGQHSDIAQFDYDYHIDIINSSNRLNSIVSSIMSFNMDIIVTENPNLKYVLVQGDTTSAFAVALSAFHNGIKIIHLEAGLRTYDNQNPYPEEQNRRLISQIADIHLCPTQKSLDNLNSEQISGEKYVVGNTVIDNLVQYLPECEYDNTILVTMHRRENHKLIKEWFIVINQLAKDHPQYKFILPIHPNPNVKKYRDILNHVTVIEPLPYNELLKILVKTRLVITDSGGLQEECSFFNKKCLTCRIVTERPEAIGQSTILVKTPNELVKIFNDNHNDYEINYECPFGDGNSAKSICDILKKY